MLSCMDIFILSDGKEIGPLTEETAQTLITQGSVTATDLAWRTGMADWAPLGELLRDKSEQSDPSESAPAASRSPSPADEAPAEIKPAIEPASARQKVFLGYLSIDFPEDLSKEQASALLNDAIEDPGFADQIGRWSAERLRLHPDLFAAEIHARKENRANHFFEICQTEGAQYFTRITKAHCQVLVGFLDVKFPTWDSRMEDAATNYFFPAIAEKFPQLIERQWKDRFHYAEGPGTESIRKTSAARFKKRAVTPIEAVLRGVALGLAVLGVLYLGQRMIPRWMGRHSTEKARSGTSSSSDQPPGVAAADRPGIAAPSASDAPASEKKEQKAAVDNSAPASPSSPASADDSQAATANSAITEQSLGKPLPDPSMPVPAAASSSESAALPSSPAAPSKSNLVLTKPVDLQLAYGKVKLPVGTAVKLVSRDGASLKVYYQNTLIVVPASSTDVDSAASEAGPSFTSPPAAAAPAANHSGES